MISAGTWPRRFALAGLAGLLLHPSRAASLFRRRYVDGRFGQIHVRIAGPERSAPSGGRPAIACFHFSPGSGRMYEAVLPIFGRDRAVLAFDTPGYGLSDPPPGPVALGDYADALVEALAALGHGPGDGPIDLIGSATGALIAIDLAARHPAWVRRVVLSGAPAFMAAERAGFTADVERMITERQADAAGSYLIKQLQDSLALVEPGTPLAPHVGAYADSILPGERWAWGELAAAQFPAEDKLPAMGQPVLLFLNPKARSAATRRTPSLLKDVTVVEPPSAGSMAWQLQPDIMADHVLRFLDGAP